MRFENDALDMAGKRFWQRKMYILAEFRFSKRGGLPRDLEGLRGGNGKLL
jgi:hypothetical protein